MSYKQIRAAAALAVAALGIAACGSDTKSSDTSTTATTTTDQPGKAALQLTDGWAKASAKGTMSAAFGTLVNSTDAPVVITSATSNAGPTQLHRTVVVNGSMQMQEVKSFTIPAHGKFVLQPGGNHVMFMMLPAALKVGSKVSITLAVRGGEPTVLNVPVRSFNGANETYSGSGSHSPATH